MSRQMRCDVCGKFIADKYFGNGAIRRLITPDSQFTTEEYETLCVEHAKPKPSDNGELK